MNKNSFGWFVVGVLCTILSFVLVGIYFRLQPKTTEDRVAGLYHAMVHGDPVYVVKYRKIFQAHVSSIGSEQVDLSYKIYDHDNSPIEYVFVTSSEATEFIIDTIRKSNPIE